MADLSIGERQMRGCALARDLNVVQSRVKRQRPAGVDGWPADEGGASPQPAAADRLPRCWMPPARSRRARRGGCRLQPVLVFIN